MGVLRDDSSGMPPSQAVSTTTCSADRIAGSLAARRNERDMTDRPLRYVPVALAAPLALAIIAAAVAGEWQLAAGLGVALAGVVPGLHA